MPQSWASSVKFINYLFFCDRCWHYTWVISTWKPVAKHVNLWRKISIKIIRSCLHASSCDHDPSYVSTVLLWEIPLSLVYCSFLCILHDFWMLFMLFIYQDGMHTKGWDINWLKSIYLIHSTSQKSTIHLVLNNLWCVPDMDRQNRWESKEQWWQKWSNMLF